MGAGGRGRRCPGSASLVLFALLAACSATGDESGQPGDDSGSPTPAEAGGPDPRRAVEVAADPEATAGDIVEAGALTSLTVDDSGRELRLYQVEEGDDEGWYASAWRIVEAGGAFVAEGPGRRIRQQSAGLPSWSIGDGFLQEAPRGGYRVLSANGEISRVPRDTTPEPARPGDVLLGSAPGFIRSSGTLPPYYRPSDGTLHRFPRATPRAQHPETFTLDDRGGVWVVPRGGIREASGTTLVAHSPDGGETWGRTVVDMPGEGVAQELSVAGDRVWMPATNSVVRGLAGLLSRPVGGDGRWRPADLAGVARSGWDIAVVQELDARGVLLTSEGSEPRYVGSTDGFRKVRPPRPRGAYPWVSTAGGRLLATGYTEPPMVSDDGGRTWERLPG